MQITEIYADADGETHIRVNPVPFAPRDFAPPSAPVGASPETALTTGVILDLPPGWDPNYHSTPRPQWVIVLSGSLHVTVTDRSAATFRPGDVFFLNDAGSKGHQSMVQGEDGAALLLVGVAPHSD